MGKPAARVGDMTAHGGMITGPGVPNVLIGGMPAATMGDMHVCPMVTPGVPPVPHVGGPLVGPVPPTVLIGGKPAACVGDMAICVGPPSSILPPGCPTVLFGQSGGGGGGSGGGSTKDAKSVSGDSAESVEPVEGTETFPVEIQRIIANAAKNMTKDQTKAVIDQVAKSLAESGYTGETQQDTYTELTLSDIAEVLKSVEKNESYEAARHFASHLDYGKLTEIAKAYVNGEDTNPDNDPNLMPTRFMLLYGMEDSKIKDINDHPDCFEDEEHKINVKNLRRGLKLLGYEIKSEDGPFDDEVWIAFVKFLASQMKREPYPFDELEDDEEEGENSALVKAPRNLTIKLRLNPDDPYAQDDMFTLYSTDREQSFQQVKTVKDNMNPNCESLELLFTGLNEKLKYSLKIEFGNSGKTEYLFRNRAYGKWV